MKGALGAVEPPILSALSGRLVGSQVLTGRDYSGILTVAFVHGLSFQGNIEQQTKTKLTQLLT